MSLPFRRSVVVGACLLIGVFAGMAGYTFQYAEGLSYFSNDPGACANCHVMQDPYDSWLKSSHREAASCNDCHVPHELVDKYLSKAVNGWNHSRHFTMQTFPDPIRIRPGNHEVLQENCITCHEDMVHNLVEFDQKSATGTSLRCTACHGSVGHLQ